MFDVEYYLIMYSLLRTEYLRMGHATVYLAFMAVHMYCGIACAIFICNGKERITINESEHV